MWYHHNHFLGRWHKMRTVFWWFTKDMIIIIVPIIIPVMMMMMAVVLVGVESLHYFIGGHGSHRVGIIQQLFGRYHG